MGISNKKGKKLTIPRQGGMKNLHAMFNERANDLPMARYWDDTPTPQDEANFCKGSLHPINLIAHYFEQQGWHFEKLNDNELLLDVAGEWCRYRFNFHFVPERYFLEIAVRVDVTMPKHALGHYSVLLQLLNESMRLGHAELCPKTGKPIWRCLIPLRGSPTITLGQLADILEEALHECDKIYPAFQLFVWDGYRAEDAMASVMFPVVGNA